MPASFGQRLRKKRRRYVKRTGKRFIRGLADFLGRQSVIGDKPIFAKSVLPWTADLEANWRTIRTELDRVLEHRERIPLFQDISPDQMRIATDTRWRTFIFYGFGFRADRSCAACPETARLLERIPNLRSAWFSILGPGYHIPAHRGVTKGIIRCHLGLKVPRAAERCRMNVGGETFHWEEGRCTVFDDTYEHEVWNDTEEERAILLIDVDRPMRLPGRLVNLVFLRALKWTAYFQDAKRNLTKWENQEERFLAAVRRADDIHVN